MNYQSTAQVLAEPEKSAPNMYKDLASQNERLANCVSRLESLGHRIIDTNQPREEIPMKGKNGNGFIPEMGNQLDSFRFLNSRLEDIATKLESFI